MYFRQCAKIFVLIAAAAKLNVHSAPADFNDVTSAVIYDVTTAVSSDDDVITKDLFDVITAADDFTTIKNIDFSTATTADPNDVTPANTIDVTTADFSYVSSNTVASKQNGGTLLDVTTANPNNVTTSTVALKQNGGTIHDVTTADNNDDKTSTFALKQNGGTIQDITTAEPNDVTTSTVASKQNGGTTKDAVLVNVENTQTVNNDNTVLVPDVNIVELVNDKEDDLNASNLSPVVPENVTPTINYESGEKSSNDLAVNNKKSAKHLIKSLFDEDYPDYLDDTPSVTTNEPLQVKMEPKLPTGASKTTVPAADVPIPGTSEITNPSQESVLNPSLITLSRETSQQFKKEMCETEGKCLPPLNSSISCFGTDLGYKQTSLALSKLKNLNQVYKELEKWKVIENIPACWKVIQPLLCSVYFPKCEDNSVQLVYTNLCKAIKTSCGLVPELNPEWENIFDCQSFRYSDCKNDEKSERLRFNSTTSCPYPLVRTQSVEYYVSGIEECGMPCETPLYHSTQYQRMQTIISVAGLIVLLSSCFAISTFLIDWSGSSKYPAVAIFYMNVCCCFSTIGWLIQLGGKENVVCRQDGTLRLQEPGSGQNENLSCVLVFILIYYFSLAAGVWLGILSYTWAVFFTSNSKVKELISPKRAYFHMAAWSIPAILTIIILAINLVEADSAYGICFVGYTNMYARILFLFLPFLIFIAFSEYNSWKCIVFLSRLYNTPDYLSAKESGKVRSTMIRMSVFSGILAFCVLVSFLCQIYEFTGRESWSKSLHDLVICGLKSQISSESSEFCSLANKPNPLVAQVHIISVFLAYVLASTWIYTKESVSSWRLFAGQLMTRKKADRPIKLKKHEMIAQAYGKRRQLEETGRLSLTLQSVHPDPVGIYQEGEQSEDAVSSDWAAALPYLVQRRGAGCGAEQLGLVGAADSHSRATSAMSNRDSMNTSIASSNHSVSLWSHRFGWGDSSKLHSAADSQSYNMSDIERLQTIYDETVKKSKKRSKRQFFKSHAQKMRPWSRLSRQGSTASGRSTQTSRSNRGADTTFSESSINSQILPAITLDPNKLNSKYKRSDYSVPKPGQSTDFGKQARDMRLGNTAEDPSFKELEEKLKKLADISKASLNSERDQPDSKPNQQEQTSPRLKEMNPVGSSVSVCVQTSLPDLTIPAANLDTCHSCQQTGRANILQKNTTTTGTQMSPQFEICHHNKDLSYRETEIFQGTGVSTRIESSTNTSGSSSQQLLQRNSQPPGDISSGPMGDSSSLENNKNPSVGGESWNSSLPLQHIEANVVSIKVVGGAPSSEESSIPSSFEKDFKMRKLTSSKNKEKENLVDEGETSIAVGDIEIPALKTKLHSTGPLIRPKEHYRGRRGAITEKFSPKADK